MDCVDRRLLDASDYDSRFRLLLGELQVVAFKDPPPLTKTQWDSLLSGITEGIVPLKTHPIAACALEPERCIDPLWVIASVLKAPEALVCYGVFPDPQDLDARGGEQHLWDS